MSNNPRDLLLLSMLAYKEQQHDVAAKLFATAMETEGLESFVSYINRMPPVSPIHDKSVDVSDNTISPGLHTMGDAPKPCTKVAVQAPLSSESSADPLAAIVNTIEAVFRSESSMLEEGDELVETHATNEADDFSEAVDHDEFIVVAAAGPIKVL